MSDQNNKQTIIEEKLQSQKGEQIIKKYIKGKFLGKGGFAKCYEFVNTETNKVYAAKIIPKSTLTKSRSRQKLISEIKIHKSIQHQYIVLFEHVFEDNDNVYILLELCVNNTLNELIKNRKRITELEVQCYILQIISALKYLHNNQIIHRDLKLGNLFLSEQMEIKIGDFGLATKLSFPSEKKNTICGTPNYIAPEILDGQQGHSYEVDVWSLGVIIYTLIIGKPPYETPDVKTTYKKIKQNQYSFPDSVPISDNAKGLIVSILQLEPSQRPTLDQILQHPFISNSQGSIPKVLPQQTLTCPPSAQFTKQYLPQGNSLKVIQQPVRILENKEKTQSIGALQEKNDDNLQKPQTAKHSNNHNGNFFKSIKNNSQQNINLPMKNQYGQENFQENSNVIWVTQWVDYSDKYGIGYILSNGNTGVFFNDSTKIIYEPNSNIVQYIERQKQSQDQGSFRQFLLEDNPPELKKKITLLQLFRNYLKEKVLQQCNISQENVNTLLVQKKQLIFVKKWMKTKHAVLFRLSNKIVQVSFMDKSEILLQSQNKLVTYVDKNGNRFNYPLSIAMDHSNPEVQKRLKYTKDVLHSLVNKNHKKSDSNNQFNN